jgi:hypothetical protein
MEWPGLKSRSDLNVQSAGEADEILALRRSVSRSSL